MASVHSEPCDRTLTRKFGGGGEQTEERGENRRTPQHACYLAHVVSESQNGLGSFRTWLASLFTNQK